MPAPVASRRTADVLLGLALVVALTSVGLLALDRDPYLGYSSDPELYPSGGVGGAARARAVPGAGHLGGGAAGRVARRGLGVFTALGVLCVALCLVGPVAGLLLGLGLGPT